MFNCYRKFYLFFFLSYCRQPRKQKSKSSQPNLNANQSKTRESFLLLPDLNRHLAAGICNLISGTNDNCMLISLYLQRCKSITDSWNQVGLIQDGGKLPPFLIVSVFWQDVWWGGGNGNRNAAVMWWAICSGRDVEKFVFFISWSEDQKLSKNERKLRESGQGKTTRSNRSIMKFEWEKSWKEHVINKRKLELRINTK